MFADDLILNYEDLYSFSKELKKLDMNIGTNLAEKSLIEIGLYNEGYCVKVMS